MVLGKRIYNSDGLILLAEGVELTTGLIRRLGTLEIGYVYIEEPMTEDIVVPELLTEETRLQAIQSIRTSFKTLESQSALKGSFLHLGKTFSGMMESIMDEISDHDEGMVLLTDMNTNDYNLYRHSLNVCLYSTVLGVSYGYSREDLKVLGLGALLHDIGKTRISQKLLNHPGRLSEEDFREVQKHTEIGFKILKDEPNIPLLSAHCALSHHERLDGSGYLEGVKSGKISIFSQIIAVADTFHAMTSERIYRSMESPFKVIEMIKESEFGKFDIKVVQALFDLVAGLPIGTKVELSNQAVGEIMYINGFAPTRPLVKLIDMDEIIDLSKQRNLYISQVISDK